MRQSSIVDGDAQSDQSYVDWKSYIQYIHLHIRKIDTHLLERSHLLLESQSSRIEILAPKVASSQLTTQLNSTYHTH
jgi:hypothetical protein